MNQDAEWVYESIVKVVFGVVSIVLIIAGCSVQRELEITARVSSCLENGGTAKTCSVYIFVAQDE